jgi:hypothetical protein
MPARSTNSVIRNREDRAFMLTPLRCTPLLRQTGPNLRGRIAVGIQPDVSFTLLQPRQVTYPNNSLMGCHVLPRTIVIAVPSAVRRPSSTGNIPRRLNIRRVPVLGSPSSVLPRDGSQG